MSYVIAWIVKTVARWCYGGDTAKATGIVSWLGLGLVVATVLGTGYLVRIFDKATHRAEVADIRATQSVLLTEQIRRALTAERIAANALTARDNAYAQIAIAREEAAVESARLSGLLSDALVRLRQRRAGDAAAPGGMPATAPGVDQCADLRAALGRAVGALELLQAAGDQVARDGQYGVDVATDAARAAAAMTPEAAR